MKTRNINEEMEPQENNPIDNFKKYIKMPEIKLKIKKISMA